MPVYGRPPTLRYRNKQIAAIYDVFGDVAGGAEKRARQYRLRHGLCHGFDRRILILYWRMAGWKLHLVGRIPAIISREILTGKSNMNYACGCPFEHRADCALPAPSAHEAIVISTTDCDHAASCASRRPAQVPMSTRDLLPAAS